MSDNRLPTSCQITHTPSQEASQLDSDALFRALSHQIRRDILRKLVHEGETMNNEELAAAIAPQDASSDPFTTSQSQHIVALTHTHLPLLADTQLIEHTHNDHVVATDIASTLVQLIDTAIGYID